MSEKRKNQIMSPLWVISLFVSLTEVVAGIAVVKASGGIQVALTAFVIVFPLLVAGIFFFTLWNRPYVFYPPTDFNKDVDVHQYVRAMSSGKDVIKADLQAEVANVRAIIDIETVAFRNRIVEMETVLEQIAAQTEGAKTAFIEYQSALKLNYEKESNIRTAFEYRSQYRVHVTTVTTEAPNRDEGDKASFISRKMQEFGFKTSYGGLGSLYYLSKYKERNEWNKIFIIPNLSDSPRRGGVWHRQQS